MTVIIASDNALKSARTSVMCFQQAHVFIARSAVDSNVHGISAGACVVAWFQLQIFNFRSIIEVLSKLNSSLFT